MHCAITSGMACVYYGVAETTNDCDLLCDVLACSRLLEILEHTSFDGVQAAYRGTMSAPLDARWLAGGWTSHLVWRGSGEAYLDVFGVPPRMTGTWITECNDIYVGRHTVAEMKRTQRDRDWPYATSLGAQMLRAGDPRGWLHLFDGELLNRCAETLPPPPEMLVLRPVLGLVGDARLKQALRVEREFWLELDRQRISVYQQAVRPYASAVREQGARGSLHEQHASRLALAQALLPPNPLSDLGIDRLLAETRDELAQLFAPALLEWLPPARDCFASLERPLRAE
jgi:hypothetical protein